MFKIIFSLAILFSTATYSQKPNYKEKHRPQFHFSPPAHWMNDPNGMVYYKGEYHLFYQYYPDSTVWGPMHWGHAISKDLVHWQHLPIALYPDSLGLIFSGSVVVDKNNTSGLQEGDEKPLVALFTYHDLKKERAGIETDFQYQGMAYSQDKGRTWKKYKHNPVIKNNGIKDFRDPKVFWHEASKHWVMVLAVADRVDFYRSDNLKEWKYTGTFGKQEGSHGGVWECPDLIEMKTDGNQTKWVLIVSIGKGGPNGGSATQYFVGNFDGENFTNSNNKETVLWLDYGPDDYAGVTWSNTGNQKLFLGWMSNWDYAQQVPTKNWRSAMTLPRELSLKKTDKGYRLFSAPSKALQALRTSTQILNGKNNLFSGLYEAELEFDTQNETTGELGVSFSNAKNETIKTGFDKSANEFYIDRSRAGSTSFSPSFTKRSAAKRISTNSTVRLHVFIDHSSVELFADSGSVSMTAVFFPSGVLSKAMVYNNGGKAKVQKAVLHQLKSIW